MVLGKTQYEVENEYYFVDLPELLMLMDQKHASVIIEQLNVASYPHITDKKVREDILKRYTYLLPKPMAQKVQSPEDQYQAQLARMKGGK